MVRAGGWEPSYDSKDRVIEWEATALTIMAEAAGARGEDVTYVSEKGDIAVSSRDAARAAQVKKSIMVRRSVRAVSSTPLRLARPRESHARPRARARRTAARRASGPRSGQDPGDDEGEFEPARWLRNTANVSFWRTETDAENAEAEYREFAEARGRTYDGRLFRAGSAVTAFEQTPDAAERDTIARCL